LKVWELTVTWENTILWEILKINPTKLQDYKFDGSYIDSWEDFLISFENKKMRDSIDAGIGRPAISKRALEILMHLLENKVQVLPLVHPKFEYFVLNVTNVIDAIDYERSTFRKLPSGRILTVKKHVFKSEYISNIDIFKVPYFTTNVYVSDRFRQTVIDNNLSGFDFIELWDSKAPIEEELIEPIEWKDPNGSESMTFSEAMKLAETNGQIYRSGRWRMKFNEEGKLEIGEVDNKGQVHYLVLIYIPPILLTQKWYLEG
jgi:hypothetical protein